MVIIWKMTVEMSLQHSLLTCLPDIHPRSVRFPGGMQFVPWRDAVLTFLILACGCCWNTNPSAKMHDPDMYQEGFLIISLHPILLRLWVLSHGGCLIACFSLQIWGLRKQNSVTLKAEVFLQSPDSRGWDFMKIRYIGICNTSPTLGNTSHWQ